MAGLMWLLLAIIQVDAFWLKTSAQVIAENGSVQLTCHVPRNQDNRWVEYGIQNYTSRRIPMEGADSPMTYQTLFKRVPCDIGAAYCMVGGIDETKTFFATKLTILVSGCGQ